jgi:hypothetical protein
MDETPWIQVERYRRPLWLVKRVKQTTRLDFRLPGDFNSTLNITSTFEVHSTFHLWLDCPLFFQLPHLGDTYAHTLILANDVTRHKEEIRLACTSFEAEL